MATANWVVVLTPRDYHTGPTGQPDRYYAGVDYSDREMGIRAKIVDSITEAKIYKTEREAFDATAEFGDLMRAQCLHHDTGYNAAPVRVAKKQAEEI